MLLDALRADERLPGAGELPEVLLDLAVPYEDVNDLVAPRRARADDEGGDMAPRAARRRSCAGHGEGR